MVHGDRRPAAKQHVMLRREEDELFVYDPRSDRVCLLNATSTVIFDLCDGARTLDEITVQVSRHYQLHETEARTAVVDTVDRLRALGVLVLLTQAPNASDRDSSAFTSAPR